MKRYINNYVPKIKDKIVSSREFRETVSRESSSCFTLLNNMRSFSNHIDEFKVFIDGYLGSLEYLILMKTFEIHLFYLQSYTSNYNSGDLN